jgi:hypothetical protein
MSRASSRARGSGIDFTKSLPGPSFRQLGNLPHGAARPPAGAGARSKRTGWYSSGPGLSRRPGSGAATPEETSWHVRPGDGPDSARSTSRRRTPNKRGRRAAFGRTRRNDSAWSWHFLPCCLTSIYCLLVANLVPGTASPRPANSVGRNAPACHATERAWPPHAAQAGGVQPQLLEPALARPRSPPARGRLLRRPVGRPSRSRAREEPRGRPRYPPRRARSLTGSFSPNLLPRPAHPSHRRPGPAPVSAARRFWHASCLPDLLDVSAAWPRDTTVVLGL